MKKDDRVNFSEIRETLLPNAGIDDYFLYIYPDVPDRCTHGIVGFVGNESNPKIKIKLEIDNEWMADHNYVTIAFWINVEEKLAELTGLHPKTIQRMRNPEEHTSLKSVIAVCVAFHLDMYNSMYLIHLAGYELTNRQEDKVYYFILSIAYKETVYDCNRMLKRLNMSPLTKL